ncbi:SDR family NAD(P)-dependent oxidoreductase [Catenulispora sp. NL8]|uniref:SDR family NAD(P)-dependent oxidoreductase n=1 Tax=Catenulispora pinistramenti TaxID=2705254 RepID=A0ABS5KK49_9ACTN|nr:SDR family NAD(P)-dependent oxidoreductase [Catenulispora pinistramenti]MBS2545876.1 SDR family NAD(P)-dependent oxidoreductase [Catenulispora pinistramenti]
MSETWFVAGAAGGLGRHLVGAALAAGHDVLAADIDADGLCELKAVELKAVAATGSLTGRPTGRLVTTELDLTDRLAVDQAVRQAGTAFGGLDVVINSAGHRGVGSVEDMDEQEWRRTIETNLYGSIHLVRAALPILRPRRRGHFVQISTIGGRRAQPGLAAYQTAAWAVGGFFEILARELAPIGIHATVLEPGGIRTARADQPLPTGGWHHEYEPTVGRFARTYQRNPDVQRGDPAKIAEAVLRLTAEPDPPTRLPLGSDAVWLAPQIAAARAAQDAAWRDLSLSTDRDGLPDFTTTEVAHMVRPDQP